MKKYLDLRSGRLTVIEDLGVKDFGGYRKRQLRCMCECGETTVITSAALVSGKTKSCGCLQKELASNKQFKHGMKGTKEYIAWGAMKTRTLEGSADSLNYHDRGIKVCERWKGEHGFESFLADMGMAPSPHHSVERVNNELGYSPDNCEWATRKEQNRNTRQNVLIEHDGQQKCVAEWAEVFGVKCSTLRDRLARGIPLTEAVKPGDRRGKYDRAGTAQEKKQPTVKGLKNEND